MFFELQVSVESFLSSFSKLSLDCLYSLMTVLRRVLFLVQRWFCLDFLNFRYVNLRLRIKSDMGSNPWQVIWSNSNNFTWYRVLSCHSYFVGHVLNMLANLFSRSYLSSLRNVCIYHSWPVYIT